MMPSRKLHLGFMLILQACFHRQTLGSGLPSSGLSFHSQAEQLVAETNIEAQHDEQTEGEAAKVAERSPRAQTLTARRSRRLGRRDAPGMLPEPQNSTVKDGQQLNAVNSTTADSSITAPKVSLPINDTTFVYNDTKWETVHRAITPTRSRLRKRRSVVKRDDDDQVGKQPDQEEPFEGKGPAQEKVRSLPSGPQHGPVAAAEVLQPPWKGKSQRCRTNTSISSRGLTHEDRSQGEV